MNDSRLTLLKVLILVISSCCAFRNICYLALYEDVPPSAVSHAMVEASFRSLRATVFVNGNLIPSYLIV